jgi:hypothetical protein
LPFENGVASLAYVAGIHALSTKRSAKAWLLAPPAA